MIRITKDIPSDRAGRKTILPGTIAGSWYPAAPGALGKMIGKALSSVPVREKVFPKINILILPHAGYAYSLGVSAHALVQIADFPFRKAVILSPAHRAYLPNRIIAPEADAVMTPLGITPVDAESRSAFEKIFPLNKNDAVHEEHACQILYPLLQYLREKEFSVLPLIVGPLDGQVRKTAAEALRQILDEETLLVISSDFTHYGKDFAYEPFAVDVPENVKKTDLEAFSLIRKGSPQDFLAYLEKTGATICGREPIALVLEALQDRGKFELLRYATSSDDSKDFSRFVCYLASAGYAPFGEKASEKTFALSDGEKETLLGIARRSIEYVFKERKVCEKGHFFPEVTENLRTKCACFVTLTVRATGALRGCIGEIEAFRPLADSVMYRAVDAAFRDPRFPQLSPGELEKVRIEISVLTPAHPVSSWKEIVIGKHGMILTKNGRSAVFLPQVAPEQGWDLETTLKHLSLKAGLGPDDWRENASFKVFEAIVFGEK